MTLPALFWFSNTRITCTRTGSRGHYRPPNHTPPHAHATTHASSSSGPQMASLDYGYLIKKDIIRLVEIVIPTTLKKKCSTYQLLGQAATDTIRTS
ncbi:hypothetical protein PCANC_06564 [Puccinia coronata f. sp. avenae]|uniref:Uncharacterized protein n=1 Tax=Puccinia coronata f. sp. avenae TaxID=200324 RepID=A0A2N5U632_9BASI|nr:hypothetical protein PCANC_26047 [Puccinia coronata f. sp. avenae]PLW33234.1 hypothetical protein PCASD_09520 [Puccinia coronata f. sp. avenae]PLW46849.1 hypothetical protein PCANC_06564 [Puccinia coronata f. sp. avenae]